MSGPGPVPAFRTAAAEALKNPQLRANFRRAMDGLMAKRAALFADPVEWRDLRAPSPTEATPLPSAATTKLKSPLPAPSRSAESWKKSME